MIIQIWFVYYFTSHTIFMPCPTYENFLWKLSLFFRSNINFSSISILSSVLLGKPFLLHFCLSSSMFMDHFVFLIYFFDFDHTTICTKQYKEVVIPARISLFTDYGWYLCVIIWSTWRASFMISNILFIWALKCWKLTRDQATNGKFEILNATTKLPSIPTEKFFFIKSLPLLSINEFALMFVNFIIILPFSFFFYHSSFLILLS